MITDCDRYWWKMNRNSIIVLFCSVPFAVLFPALSLITPILILYLVCDKFYVLHKTGERQDDSIRFIISMPFSRGQIFYAYVKGLAVTSASYFIIVCSIRLILTLTDTSRVFYWNSNISTGYEVFLYIAVLGTYLLIANLFQIFVINKYTVETKSSGQLITLFILMPSIFVWLYLKEILIFATGMLRMRSGVSYEVKEIMKLGIPGKSAEISSVIIYSIIAVTLVVWLIFVLNRERVRFTKVVSQCQEKS